MNLEWVPVHLIQAEGISRTDDVVVSMEMEGSFHWHFLLQDLPCCDSCGLGSRILNVVPGSVVTL